MKVWMLFKGEDYEGGSVQGLYSTREVALASAEAYMREHTWEGTDYPWVHNPHPGMEDWWHSGCDYLYIKEMEVSTEPSTFECPPCLCPICSGVVEDVPDENATVAEVLDNRCSACKEAGRCDACDKAEGPVECGRCEACRRQDEAALLE